MNIIKNPDYLNPSIYQVPEELIYPKREAIQTIENIIEEFLKGYTPVKRLIYGPPGCGKTTIAYYLYRKYLPKIREKEKYYAAYINCKNLTNRFSILSAIIAAFPVQVEENGAKELKPEYRFRDWLQKIDTEFDILLIIDELSKIKVGSATLVLDALTLDELPEIKPKISFIAFTNNPRLPKYLKKYAKDILDRLGGFILTPFTPYTEEELFEIIKKRAKYSLHEGTYDEDLLYYIVEKALELGKEWPRDVIELLRNAASLAESQNANKIEKEHVDEIIKIERKKEILNEMTTNYAQVIFLMKFYIKKTGKRILEKPYNLYKKYYSKMLLEYKERTGSMLPETVKKSTFFYYINKALQEGILKEDIIVEGPLRGRTVYIIKEDKLNFYIEALRDLIKKKQDYRYLAPLYILL